MDGIEPKDNADPALKWAHIDIAGTMEVCHESPFQFIVTIVEW